MDCPIMSKYGLYDCIDDEVYDLIQAAKWWHEVREFNLDCMWIFADEQYTRGYDELLLITETAINILHRTTNAVIEMEE